MKSVMLGHPVKATIGTFSFFLHRPKHVACAVNHSNKHILLHIIWKSYTLRGVSIPCCAYGKGRALRGWARSRACRRLLGRRQRPDHCLHTSHTAALPAPPPRRPVSRSRYDPVTQMLFTLETNRRIWIQSSHGKGQNKSCSLYSVSLALAACPSILFAFNRE